MLYSDASIQLFLCEFRYLLPFRIKFRLSNDAIISMQAFADLRKIYKSCQNMLLKHLRIEASHHEPAISHRRTQRK